MCYLVKASTGEVVRLEDARRPDHHDRVEGGGGRGEGVGGQRGGRGVGVRRDEEVVEQWCQKKRKELHSRLSPLENGDYGESRGVLLETHLKKGEPSI